MTLTITRQMLIKVFNAEMVKKLSEKKSPLVDQIRKVLSDNEELEEKLYEKLVDLEGLLDKLQELEENDFKDNITEKEDARTPDFDSWSNDPPFMIEWSKKVIEAGLIKPYHGQGFRWLGEGYRNETLMYWHKDKGVIPPYTKIDDYGSVWPDFLVGDDGFSPNEWENVVDHNSIIFLEPKLVDKIKESVTADDDKSWSGKVIIKNKAYFVSGTIDKEYGMTKENFKDHISNVFSVDGRSLTHGCW